MTPKKIIVPLISVLAFLACILAQSGFINQNPLLAVESGTSKTISKQAKTEPKNTLSTVDVNNIIVKEHHWIENGYGIHWTPDGKHLIFCKANDGFYVMNPLCQDVKPLGKGMYFEGVSLDGNILYGSHPKFESFSTSMSAVGIFAIDIKDGTTKQISDIEFSRLYLAPDGKHAMALLPVGEWTMVNMDGTPPKSLKGAIWQSWSADGSKFLARANDGVLYAFDITGNSKPFAVVKRGQAGWVGNTGKVWSREVSKNKDVVVMNPDGSEAKTVVRSNLSPVFSLSGSCLIYEDPETNINTLLRFSDGKKLKLESIEPALTIWLKSDDKVIVSDRSQWYMLSLNTPEGKDPKRLLIDEETPCIFPFVSPNSNLIAFNSRPVEIDQSQIKLGIANLNNARANILIDMGTAVIRDERIIPYPLVWSPTSDAVAYCGPSSNASQKAGVIILGIGKPQKAIQTVAKKTDTQPKEITLKEATKDEKPKTVDVSDIVIKEHHWVEKGYNPTWAPDGKYIIFQQPRGRPGGGLNIIDTSLTKLNPVGKDMLFIDISPDGKTLYGIDIKEVNDDKNKTYIRCLSAVNIKAGAIRHITDIEFADAKLSPDGKIIYVSKWGQTSEKGRTEYFFKGIFAIDVKSGAVKQITDIEYLYGIRHLSSNGKYILVVTRDKIWTIVNTDGTGYKAIGSVDWSGQSEDNSRFLFLDKVDTYMFNADDGTISMLKGKGWNFAGHTNKICKASGEDIVFCNPDGTEQKVITKCNFSPRFSPSGECIIYRDPADSILTMIRVSDGSRIKTNLSKIIPETIDNIIWFPGEDKCLIHTRSQTVITNYKYDAQGNLIPEVQPQQQRDGWYLLSFDVSTNICTEKFMETGDEPWQNRCSLSNDSRLIAFSVKKAGLSGGREYLGITHSDGTEPILLDDVSTDGGFYGIEWSPLNNAFVYQEYSKNRRGIGYVTITHKESKPKSK